MGLTKVGLHNTQLRMRKGAVSTSEQSLSSHGFLLCPMLCSHVRLQALSTCTNLPTPLTLSFHFFLLIIAVIIMEFQMTFQILSVFDLLPTDRTVN